MKTSLKSLIVGILFLLPGIVISQVIYLPQTGQSTSYATGDDGDLKKGASWPTPRFIDNGDGTITDELTGLMWLGAELLYQDIINKSWGDVFPVIDDLNDTLNLWWNFDAQFLQVYTARYTDWRLPNINELESLVNAEAPNQAEWLNGHGFQTENAIYWSSTSVPNSNKNRRVNMSDGDVDTWPGNTAQCFPLPVRGPYGGQSLTWKTGQTESFHPSDDGEFETGVTWPEPRFIDNGDGTITDNLTGLMWVQDAGAFDFMSWNSAFNSISDFNGSAGNLGYSDWRLPNRKELYSLLDFSREDPALPADHPFDNVQNSPYWTSTTCAADVTKAWRIFMDQGTVTSLQKESDPGQWWFQSRVWPVRGEVQEPTSADGERNDLKKYTYNLAQNYPNPFNPSTTLTYRIPEKNHVVLRIYNTLGQEVKTLVNETMEPGEYAVKWDGTDRFGNKVASGVFFSRLKVGQFVKSKRMMLLK